MSEREQPPACPDEVFGFWFRGIWQPVQIGTMVTAVDYEHVRFTYPPPENIRKAREARGACEVCGRSDPVESSS